MFIAALFTIAKTWKQPKCPLTDEWIKKMQYIYTMEDYSAIKKNEIMPFAATWLEPEIIILSKSERERQIPYDITYMWNLKYDTYEPIYETETDSQIQRTDLWVPRGREVGKRQSGNSGLTDALLYVEWINNKVLLYSTENYIQYPEINHNGKRI